MPGIVVIDGDPLEPRLQVGFHLRNQIAGGLAQVGQLDAVLGRDDEAELVPVLAPAIEKVPTVDGVLSRGIDLAALAVARDAVALEVAQMCVDRLGADDGPPARRAAG